MRPFELRPIGKEDIARIAECENLIFSDASSEKAIASLFDAGAVGVCALVNGQICGYAYCADSVGEAELLRIAVLPEHRGQYIASAILNCLHKVLRDEGFSRICLEVRESNTSARALYTSFGYNEDGKRRNFYSNPREDAVLMSKDLHAFRTE